MALQSLGRADLVRLADALESGRLRPAFTVKSVGRYVSDRAAADVQAELNRLHGDGVHPRHVAYTARLLADEKQQTQAVRDRVDLVWTGPEVTGSSTRDAATVARELLGTAQRSVLLSSYAVDTDKAKLKGLLGQLATRMDELEDLRVQLFVNIPRRWKHGMQDDRDADVIVREFAHKFRAVWPGERLPEVFYDPRALEEGHGDKACLHAKVVVVDEAKALVSSANLTEAAHERNIEAGVLVADEAFARNLVRQFRSLVEAGKLDKLGER
jgi:phosphatidylserine/phosphatidylglycerophosphate/cardiolipin synthase-like enzyme